MPKESDSQEPLLFYTLSFFIIFIHFAVKMKIYLHNSTFFCNFAAQNE